jgi:hypothetical protein
VDLGQGKRRSVAEIIGGDLRASQEALEQMERTTGVGVIEKKEHGGRRRKAGELPPEERFLFVAGSKLKQHNSLRGTRWQDQNANDILVRLPQAEPGQVSIGNSKARGVFIPLVWITEHFLS